MRLAFYQPDIPQNLGAAIRLSACFGVPLDIIEPCGFPLTDKALRRSAMDYGALAEIRRWPGWLAFYAAAPGRVIVFTTSGEHPLDAFAFEQSDTLLFGRESAGVPDEVKDAAFARLRIPMQAGARSLNVAMSAGIALWEARRSVGPGKPLFENGIPGPPQ